MTELLMSARDPYGEVDKEGSDEVDAEGEREHAIRCVQEFLDLPMTMVRFMLQSPYNWMPMDGDFFVAMVSYGALKPYARDNPFIHKIGWTTTQRWGKQKMIYVNKTLWVQRSTKLCQYLVSLGCDEAKLFLERNDFECSGYSYQKDFRYAVANYIRLIISVRRLLKSDEENEKGAKVPSLDEALDPNVDADVQILPIRRMTDAESTGAGFHMPQVSEEFISPNYKDFGASDRKKKPRRYNHGWTMLDSGAVFDSSLWPKIDPGNLKDN